MKRFVIAGVLALALASVASATASADVKTAVVTAPKAPTPTAGEVTVQYQRVGHDLLALAEQRGHFDCGDLIPRFRAIKLELATATPAARIAAAATLAEIAQKIERLRGIRVAAACLENPLADGCRE